MARPTKSGIDYFPLDCEWDNKVEMFITEKEATGLAVLLTLWQLIYKNGYYIDYNNDLILLIKKRINVDINLINDCINSAVSRGIFDQNLFEAEILTSKAIQKRYFEAARRKKTVPVIPEFLLIDVSAYNNLINVDINSINAGKNALKLKVKEKVNVKVKVSDRNNCQHLHTQTSNLEISLPLLTEISDYAPLDYTNREHVTVAVKNLLSSFCNIEQPDKAAVTSFTNIVMNTKQVKNQTAFEYLFSTFNEFHTYPEGKRNLGYLYKRVEGRINDALIEAREKRATLNKQNEKQQTAAVDNEIIEQLANKMKTS